MRNSFDLVRSAIGESAGPDLVQAIDALPLDKVDEIAERILDSPRSGPLPKRPVTEIWPLIPLRASLFFDHLDNGSPVMGYVAFRENLIYYILLPLHRLLAKRLG